LGSWVATMAFNVCAVEVDCPICNQKILEAFINEHLDFAHSEPTAQTASPKRMRKGSANNESAHAGHTDLAASKSAAVVVNSIHSSASAEPDSEPTRPGLDHVKQRALPLQRDADSRPSCSAGATLVAEPMPVAPPAGVSDTLPSGTSSSSSIAPSHLTKDTRIRTKGVQETGVYASGRSGEYPDVLQEAVVVRPEDDLEMILVSERKVNMQRVDDAISVAHELVVRLGDTVTRSVEAARGDLEAYPDLGAPLTYDQQRARNEARERLEHLVHTTQKNVEQILGATQQPCDVLQATRSSLLTRIDDAIKRLTLLRSETAQLYVEQGARVERDREERERVIAELVPRLAEVDRFVQCLTQEVASETAEARDVYQSRLHQLEAEEAQYLRANESLDENPTFGKVRDEVQATRDRLKAQRDRDRAQGNLQDGWSSLLNKIPTPPVVKESRKRRFWQVW